MSSDTKVERSQSVAAQTVRPALEYDARRAERRDCRLHDGLEELNVTLVVDTILKWHIQGKVLAKAVANLVDGARSGEEVARVLVERHGEYTVRLIEGFLDTITVMDVNINVEHTGMMSGCSNKEIKVEKRVSPRRAVVSLRETTRRSCLVGLDENEI